MAFARRYDEFKKINTELIALALSIAARCEWCISYHVKSALDAGATKKELMETGYFIRIMPYFSNARLLSKRLYHSL